MSPCLFCVYLDSLLIELRRSGLGCHIGGVFFGAFCYADDVIILSPSRDSLQLMLNICQKFAEDHSMQFSTDPNPSKSKTKCLHFTLKKRAVHEVKLNGNNLPWVDRALHLGNKLTTDISMAHYGMNNSVDLLQKRSVFFQNVHELRQAFGSYDTKMICEVIRIFGLSFYGSPLWSLNSEEHLKLNRSWNTVVKIIWDLPYATHKRFVESLTQIPHVQSTLHGRYIGFIENLSNSKKVQLQVLFNICLHNQLSNTGQNIAYLLKEYELDDMKALIENKYHVKTHRVNPLEDGEEWKVDIIEELSLIKKGFLEIEMDEGDIEVMLESITTD